MWRGRLRFAKQRDENLHANNLSKLTIKIAFNNLSDLSKLTIKIAERAGGSYKKQPGFRGTARDKRRDSLIRCSARASSLQEITAPFQVSMTSTEKRQ